METYHLWTGDASGEGQPDVWFGSPAVLELSLQERSLGNLIPEALDAGVESEGPESDGIMDWVRYSPEHCQSVV